MAALFQMIQAHNGHVVAVAVSPDSKFVATLSYVDLRIKFFQVGVAPLVVRGDGVLTAA